MKRKLLAVLLAGTMMSGLLAGCGQEDKPESVAGSEVETTVSTETTETEVVEELTYPLDTDVKLTFWIRDQFTPHTEYANADQSPFHTGLEKMTGVDIDWEYPAQGADVTTAFNLILQEEKLPHIIYGGATLSKAKGEQLLDDGVIYELTDYLPEYAPDLWEYMTRPENEEIYKLWTTDDGRVYGFPNLAESDYGGSWMGPIVRQDWLEECGLKAPVTMEDWEDVMVAFKEKYGYAFMPPITQLRMVGMASGTGAYGSFNSRYYVDDNNQVQFAQVQDEYKEYVTVLKRWYDMDLLDKDFTTANVNGVRAKALNNQVGVTFGPTSLLTNLNADAEEQNTGAVWVATEYPRVAEGEPTCFVLGNRTSYGGTAPTVITTRCTEEELITAIKFMNYNYTEEGINYWNYGEEGVSCYVDNNNDIQWTDKIMNDPNGMADALKKYTGLTGAGPSMQLDRFKVIKNTEAAVEALDLWAANSNSAIHTLPALTFSEAEQESYTDKNSAISTYVQTMGLKWVTGEESLDTWDAYVAELDKLGLQECLKIQQAAFDRYLAK